MDARNNAARAMKLSKAYTRDQLSRRSGTYPRRGIPNIPNRMPGTPSPRVAAPASCLCGASSRHEDDAPASGRRGIVELGVS